MVVFISSNTKPDASIKNLNPTPVKAVKGKIDYIATNYHFNKAPANFTDMAKLCEKCKGLDVNEALLQCIADGLEAAEEGEEAEVEAHDECLELLVKAGADVNERATERNVTVVIYAAGKRNKELVDLILTKGPNLKAGDTDGNSALRLAATEGFDEIVDALIAAGADVNIGDGEFNIPIVHAITNGHEKCVDSLIKAGSYVHLANSDGLTPVMQAAESGNVRILEALIKAGADVNDANEEVMNAMMIAQEDQHTEVLSCSRKPRKRNAV